MMKRFETKGKLLALMMLILGLAFAGCVGDTSSSEEEATIPQSSHIGQVPMMYDNGDVVIGDGSGAYDFDPGSGHMVRLAKSAACSGTADGAECDIVLTNLDPAFYMTNVRVWTNTPTLPGADGVVPSADDSPETLSRFDNADFDISGVSVHAPYDDPSCLPSSCPPPGDDSIGEAQTVAGGGFCYAEDGSYDELVLADPYNYDGCKVRPISTRSKPIQIIHPLCGSNSAMWDFGNQASRYYFWASVDATWYPINPASDGRYDFDDRTTYYINVADKLDKMKDNGAVLGVRGKWNLGSYVRSYVHGGWNPDGAPSPGWSLGAGTAFTVNVLAEYANRIENRNIASTADPNYEYYKQFAWLLRFNNAAVTWDSAYTAFQSAGCTAFNMQCWPTYVIDTNPNGVGWIQANMYTENKAFTFLAPGVKYINQTGNVLRYGYVYYSSAVPGQMAHKGMVKIKADVLSLMPSLKYNSTAVIPEGIDAAPDANLMLLNFTATGSVGMGSEFIMDHHTSNVMIGQSWTNGSLIPGGFVGGSDDWSNVCFQKTGPMTGNLMENCLTNDPYLIVKGNESSNPGISQTGCNVKGFEQGYDGAFQQWSTYICIQ